MAMWSSNLPYTQCVHIASGSLHECGFLRDTEVII